MDSLFRDLVDISVPLNNSYIDISEEMRSVGRLRGISQQILRLLQKFDLLFKNRSANQVQRLLADSFPYLIRSGFFVVLKNAVTLMALTFVISLVKPAMAAEIDCRYDSNSEWPWLESRVCQIDKSTILLDDGGQPVCTDARADKDGDGWGWEFDQSCVIDPNQSKKESNVPGLAVVQEDLVVFEQDFESASVGPYRPEVLNEQWDTPLWHMGFKEDRVEVVDDDNNGKAIKVTFPAHLYGSDGAAAFLTDLSFGVGFERNFEELYVSYDVKFAEDFDFVQGGKLPGLCGYNLTQAPKDGCNTGGGFPTGYDGWSARGMWREDGILENYVYHADQFYQYGDDEHWDVKAEPGKWHTIQHRIVMNTVGEANGVVEAWFDGVKVLRSDTMLYRKTADIGINLFYFSTFYGGADASWAPPGDQYIYFDNFRIATTPLVDTLFKAAVNNTTTVPENINGESDSGIIAIEGTSEEEANGTENRTNQNEPVLSAAIAVESGGGVFYPWILALLILFRRNTGTKDPSFSI